MLCSVCAMLMSDILIHLKGCAKTVPLHTTLPANPRHWLGADPKTTPVGLCTTRSQVIPNHRSQKAKQPGTPLILIHTSSWTSDLLLFSSTVALFYDFFFNLVRHHIVLVRSPQYFSSIWTLERRGRGLPAVTQYMCSSLRWLLLTKPKVLP